MLSVGHLKPNDFGLFDILGNAWEWTMRKVPAESLFVEDPPGDDVEDADDLKSVGQLRRITKGASFLSASNNVRASQRNWIPPSAVSKISGFRLAKTMSTP
jgi:formylglycine-generating enzyme required for sulfatase activity